MLRHQKNLSCVWISYRGSRGKPAYVNVTSLGQVRTCDHALLPCDGNSIRHVSFRFFRRNNRSAQHSDRRRKLHFLNNVCCLFDGCRRPSGSVCVSRRRMPRGTRRLLPVWNRRWPGLEGIRNGLPDFFEKIPNGIGVDAASAQKEQSGHWQAEPARINLAFERFISVHCQSGIFHDCWEGKRRKFFCRTGFSLARLLRKRRLLIQATIIKTGNATGTAVADHAPTQQKFQNNHSREWRSAF